MLTGNAQTKAPDVLEESFADELDPGTPLMHGQYRIAHFLNAGGFGITYTARDSLDRKVVIKECFPSAFCRRSKRLVSPRSRAHKAELSNIIRLFVQEAKSLAKLKHPNIVGVHQVFEDNNTAYMVLDFVNGRDLLEIIEDPEQSLEPVMVQDLLAQLLDAIGYIHRQGVLHRDISPDNILINSLEIPILIDFGAAREQVSQSNQGMSALRVVKDGYSPQEFYVAGAEQGPSSDLYALAATFYHLISGVLAPDSQARLSAVAAGDPDPYVPLVGQVNDYPKRFLAALDRAMAVLPRDRMSSADEWLEQIGKSEKAEVPVESTAASKPRDWRVTTLLAGGTAMAMLTAGAILLPPVVKEPADRVADITVTPLPPVDGGAAAPSQNVARLEEKLLSFEPTPVLQSQPVELAALSSFDLPLSLGESDQVAKEPAQAAAATEQTKPSASKLELVKSRYIELPIEAAGQSAGEKDRIFAVDGVPVSTQADIDALLANKITPLTGYSVPIAITAGPSQDRAQTAVKNLRVAERLTLPNGLAFEAEQAADGWETRVAAVPSGLKVALEPGDILVGDLASNALLTDADALDRLLTDGIRSGTTQFAFAVRRGTTTWAAEIDLGAATKPQISNRVLQEREVTP